MNLPLVSIIIPTLNEEKNLPHCLESLKKIAYPKVKQELIVVDGGSIDKTIAIARKFGAKVYHNPLKIRGAACKIGVEKARGELIAFTDADCVVPKNWLKGLLAELKNDQVASVGGPNITPKDDTNFAKAAGEVISLLTKPGSRYGFSSNKITETYHNPGCNVLYRKSPILKAGNFNPDLLTCEDEELDFRLLKNGYKILFTPRVVVNHYRRPTYKKIFIQFYRFAFGRSQAIKLHPKMARWFHFLPSLALISLVGILPAFMVFLAVSIYLSLAKKTVPFYTYWLIFCLWFLGWSLGFIAGFLKTNKQVISSI